MRNAVTAALRQPLVHVALLTLVVAWVFVRASIAPQDDHFLYQAFIESLAAGRLDLSIPGFHGASFLAVPLHLLTGSPLTNIHFQIFCALCIVPVGYAAARALLRDTFLAVLWAYVLALSPFFFYYGLRGFTVPSYVLFIHLTILLRARASAWAWLPLSLCILMKPFAVALLPLFLVWRPAQERAHGLSRGWLQGLFACLLPAAYIVAQFAQIGRIIVGVHADLGVSNVFLWSRFPLNAAHGVQMLFSIHNFYFPDPAKTAMGNLVQGSPLVLFLGVLALLYLPAFWARDRRLGSALLLGCVIAYVLACALDHMDNFYLQMTVILLSLAALPVIAQWKRLLPLLLATYHFQFLYVYLATAGVFFTDYSLFAIPLIVDILALLSAVFLAHPHRVLRTMIAEWRA